MLQKIDGSPMKKQILVVDDDQDNNFSLKVGLEELDPTYEVISVESGKQCLDFLKKNQMPDLILLDIMMPEMNGWELFDKIKEHQSWKTIPIFFLTARVDNTTKTAGIFIADDYIEKPYELNDVKKRIDKVLITKTEDIP